MPGHNKVSKNNKIDESQRFCDGRIVKNSDENQSRSRTISVLELWLRGAQARKNEGTPSADSKGSGQVAVHQVEHGRVHSACIALSLAFLAACAGGNDSQVEAEMNAKLNSGDMNGAMTVVKSHLREHPQSGKSRLLLGRLLLSSGDAPGAEIELRRTLGSGAAETAVLIELGRALLAQNKVSGAIALLSGAKPDTPQEAGDVAEVHAQALLMAGEPQRAEQVLTEAIRRAPNHLKCLLLAAQLAREGQTGAQSLSQAQTLAKQFPDSAAVLTFLAKAQAAQNDATGASLSYEQALKLDPKHAPAHTALVMAALGKDDLAAAKTLVQRMAKALPGQAESAYAQSMVAYFSGNFAAARELQQQLLRRGSDYPPLLVLAGMTERRMGASAKAEVLLSKAMALLPDALEPRRELAALRVAQADGTGALNLLKPLLDKRTADASSWVIAGQAHALVGNFKAADAAFATAKTLQPRDVAVQLQYARSLLMRGQEESGLRELGKAAAADRSGESDMAIIVAYLQRKDTTSALKALEQLAQKSPGEPVVAVLRGRVLEQLGKAAQARQSFEQALALRADFLPAIDGLAALDMAANQPQAARTRYESYLKRQPRSAATMIRLAEISHLSTGRAAAVAWLDKAVAVNPADPGPWSAAVELERRMGDEARALNRARQAAAALPDDYELQRHLAAALQSSGDNNQAVSVLQRMNQLRPRSAEPRLLLAQAHLLAGNTSAARSEVDKAWALEPSSPEVFRAQIVLLLKEGQSQKALALAQGRQKQTPQDPAVWLTEAEIHASSNNWPAAVAVLRQGLVKAPSSKLAARQSDAMRRAALSTEAAQFEQSWFTAHPEDAEFTGSLGQAADLRGDAAEAATWYRHTLKLQPDAPVVLNNLAQLLIKTKPSEALTLAQRAVQLAPETAPFLDTLAQAQAALGQVEQALKTQTKAVSLAPRAGDLRLQRARLLLATGEKQKAREELEWLRDRGSQYARQDEVAQLMATIKR